MYVIIPEITDASTHFRDGFALVKPVKSGRVDEDVARNPIK